MAPRTRQDVVDELVASRDADPVATEMVVGLLESAGMRPAAMRRWLMHPRLAHPVPAWFAEEDRWAEWSAMGALAVHPDEAVAETRRYVSATSDQRRIADAFVLPMAGVTELTGADPQRAETIARLAGELLDALNRKPVRLEYVARAVLNRDKPERLLDQIADGHEDDLLTALRAGTLDLEDRERDGTYLSFRP
ncbi:MAG TPA: hypothetical protein VNT03_21970 [Baekduia sp.]|nr:hypothetical protein [Baekduia sp.]